MRKLSTQSILPNPAPGSDRLPDSATAVKRRYWRSTARTPHGTFGYGPPEQCCSTLGDEQVRLSRGLNPPVPRLGKHIRLAEFLSEMPSPGAKRQLQHRHECLCHAEPKLQIQDACITRRRFRLSARGCFPRRRRTCATAPCQKRWPRSRVRSRSGSIAPWSGCRAYP